MIYVQVDDEHVERPDAALCRRRANHRGGRGARGGGVGRAPPAVMIGVVAAAGPHVAQQRSAVAGGGRMVLEPSGTAFGCSRPSTRTARPLGRGTGRSLRRGRRRVAELVELLPEGTSVDGELVALTAGKDGRPGQDFARVGRTVFGGEQRQGRSKASLERRAGLRPGCPRPRPGRPIQRARGPAESHPPHRRAQGHAFCEQRRSRASCADSRSTSGSLSGVSSPSTFSSCQGSLRRS